MKKILFFTILLCYFSSLSFAKPYIPMTDSEGTLKILKEYRDIFREDYGIDLKDNNSIMIDQTDIAIKGKVFGKAIEATGYSLDETINTHLDKYKTRLAYGHSDVPSNRHALGDLFEGLDIYILNLKKDNISEANVSWATRNKMFYWFARRGILKNLDRAIINNEKQLAEDILNGMQKYGDIEDADIRKTLIKFAGLLGVTQNREEATKEAMTALKRVNKYGELYKVYQALIWRSEADTKVPSWTDNAIGELRHKTYFNVIQAYVLAYNTDTTTYERLHRLLRYGFGGKHLDPFTNYIYLTANIGLDDYNKEKKIKARDAAKKELTRGWVKDFALKMHKTLEKYGDSLPVLAFYCFAPRDKEVQDILNEVTQKQKNYAQTLNDVLNSMSSEPAPGYYKSRKNSIQTFKIQFKINKANNTIVATITNFGKHKKIEATGKIDTKASALSAIELRANGNNFLEGRSFFLSLKPSGRLAGSDKFNDYFIGIKPRPLLHQLISQNKFEEVKKQLAIANNTEETNFWGSTPLMVAVEAKHTNIVEFLIANGANVNSVNEIQLTALMYAAEVNSAHSAKILIQNGAKVDATDIFGNSPLIFGSYNGHVSVIQALLSGGANVNAKNEEGSFALLEAAKNGYYLAVQALLQGGADIEMREKKDESTALMFASKHGKRETVQVLLENGADVNAINKNKSTALMFAAQSGHMEIVKLLLAYGANKDMKSQFGNNTAAKFAKYERHTEIVHLLNSSRKFTKAETSLKLQSLSKQKNDDTSQPDPSKILEYADKGNYDFVKASLDSGSKLNSANSKGITILHYASSNGHKKIVQLLVQRGANINLLSNDGWSALMLASVGGHIDIVKLLIQKGADVNLLDAKKRSALIWAAINGHSEVTKLLLVNGADITIKTVQNKTALDIATEKSHKEVMTLLQDASKQKINSGAELEKINKNHSTVSSSTSNEKNAREAEIIEHEITKTKLAIEEIRKMMISIGNASVVGIGNDAPISDTIDKNISKPKSHSDSTPKNIEDLKQKLVRLQKELSQLEELVDILSISSDAEETKNKVSTSNPAPSVADKTSEVNKATQTTTPPISPTAPAQKKPGVAVIIPTTTDTMSLTSFGPDQEPDYCIQVIALNKSPLIAVRLESMGGASASWKTKDVKTKAQGVLAVMKDGKVINAADASFTLDVTKETPLNLCAQDNGVIASKKNRMRVIFFHKDGTRNYSVLQR